MKHIVSINDLAIKRLEVFNSAEEGHPFYGNQYTSAAVSADESSGIAQEKSVIANKHQGPVEHAQAKSAHENAYQSHKHAHDLAVKAGNMKAVAEHSRMMGIHHSESLKHTLN